MTRPLSLRLYVGATAAMSPFLPAVLRARARRGKEDPARLGERFGRASIPRPDGPIVWLHAVSVGESLSLLAVVERFGAQRPDATVLITTGTRAAADLLAQRLPDGVIHQYAPVDTPAAAARFLDYWRPSLGVFAESELWPNLIVAAAARGVRLALVSAGMSKRSFAGWRRVPAAARTVLAAFDLVLARDAAAAERLRALGARVDGLADLKFGAAALPVDQAVLADLRASLAGRRVVLAASTHAGEEEVLLTAYAPSVSREKERDPPPPSSAGQGRSKIIALRSSPAPLRGGGGSSPPCELTEGARRSLLVIASRHPERGVDIAAAAAARGFAVGRRSLGDDPADLDVYIADTLGELGLWYRLADMAIIGGSLVAGIGGHNPLEAARLGCPFIAGTQVEKWPVYADLAQAGATRLIASGELAVAFDAGAQAMAARARDFVAIRDAAAAVALDRIVAMAPR